MNMRLIFAAGLLAAGLAGCTTAQPIRLPDGSQGQLLRCNGIQHSIADCYLKAGEVCPGGYDVLAGGTSATPFLLSSGGFSATPSYASGGYSTIGGSSVHRSLMVRCHGGDEPEPGYSAGDSIEPFVPNADVPPPRRPAWDQ